MALPNYRNLHRLSSVTLPKLLRSYVQVTINPSTTPLSQPKTIAIFPASFVLFGNRLVDQ
jgi:hypothetical protein